MQCYIRLKTNNYGPFKNKGLAQSFLKEKGWELNSSHTYTDSDTFQLPNKLVHAVIIEILPFTSLDKFPSNIQL